MNAEPAARRRLAIGGSTPLVHPAHGTRQFEQYGSMRYTVPLRVTVEVDSTQNVIDAAKVELQRKFQISDEEWEASHLPFVEEHFGHALGILLTSDAVSGSLTGILERTVPGIRVTGTGVSTSEVEQHAVD